jgi:hypothetical protein
MQFRVIANEVSARNSFLNQFWALAHIPPNQEKCRLRVVAVEEIKEFGRDRGIRPIVKGERQLPRGVRPANGSSKKLRARMRCSIRDNRPGRERRRNSDKERMHARISSSS